MTDSRNQERTPTDARRLKNFAAFFKSYMSLSTIVAAAVPIPVTSQKLIPIFESQRGSLATFTSLTCFLILSYVFYRRHTIGRVLFAGEGVSRRMRQLLEALPLLLILGCFACIYSYQQTLNGSVQDLKAIFASEAKGRYDSDSEEADYNVLPDGRISFSSSWLMENVTSDKVTNGPLLMALYMGIFVTAEAAFTLMALREFLQDTLGLSDADIINPLPPVAI